MTVLHRIQDSDKSRHDVAAAGDDKLIMMMMKL